MAHCSRRLDSRPATAERWLALFAAALLLTHPVWCQLSPLIVPPSGPGAGAGSPSLNDDGTPKLCQGKTPGKIIIDRVVAYPADGQQTAVVLRNVGGQTVNLTGYRLTDSDTRNVQAAQNLNFGQAPCDKAGNATLDPTRTLTLHPKGNGTNPCGYPFGISFRDEVNLFDNSSQLVASAKWSASTQGSSFRLLPSVTTLTPNGAAAYNDGAPVFRELPETQNVVETLRQLGGYSTFLAALKATGLDQKLTGAADPNYPGAPPAPVSPTKMVDPEFPWWFGFGIDRSKLPPPPPPPPPPPAPPPGIPAQGPYTVLAPTDDAFNQLLSQLGGGRRLSLDALLALPELPTILTYHILPGKYLTNDMYNNTPIYTCLGAVQVTPFNDPCMTEGRVMLHDGCVDKPTPDNFTCAEQVAFAKCYYPFMTSALAAQWQGGFCQRTCQRCSCAPDSGITCAQIVAPDVRAGNGVVQGVSRVLFPPPVFNKTVDAAAAAALANFPTPPGGAAPGAVPVPGAAGAAAPGGLPNTLASAQGAGAGAGGGPAGATPAPPAGTPPPATPTQAPPPAPASPPPPPPSPAPSPSPQVRQQAGP